MVQSFNGPMTQFLNQRLRLLPVFRVEPFSESVVDDGQRVASCMPYIALASFPLCCWFLFARANRLLTASTKACALPGSK